jgi:hypothetical protein
MNSPEDDALTAAYRRGFLEGAKAPTNLDLMTDIELLEVVETRLRAKELAYLFAWGSEGGENWMYLDSLDYDHLQQIYEHAMEEFNDCWLPTDEELLQWEADSEEVDDEED